MTTTARPVTAPARRRLSTTDLALVAAFAALIAACAVVGGIPVGGAGVDITLQGFGVLLAGCVLGPLRGFLAVALYLGLGAIGLPVFSDHASGLGPFTGVSAGYLWSFPLAAALAGFLVTHVAGPARKTRALFVFACAIAASVLVVHTLGIAGMKLYLDVSWGDALRFDMPFWLGDVVKMALVALVAAEVHRAFPQLLHGR
ncbi:biotin transporter BioY [Nocardioides pantholopis]|uniref:biotin transporter BioY n=1 Tax=Nocardioides pantholopis TaxID=2483798 RepID=UPI000F08FB59|nr:biotin transporter BioY [Nocardioides pantholopis]